MAKCFLAWVAQGLGAHLANRRPGDSGQSSHAQNPGSPRSPQAKGARLLYLPPYSPDFNPIEPMWSKIKQILRSHAPRTETDLLLAAKTAFQAISIIDCKSFFFNAKCLHHLCKCSKDLCAPSEFASLQAIVDRRRTA